MTPTVITIERLRQAFATMEGYEEGARRGRRIFLSLVDQGIESGLKQATIARELGISRQRLNDMRRDRGPSETRAERRRREALEAAEDRTWD